MRSEAESIPILYTQYSILNTQNLLSDFGKYSKFQISTELSWILVLLSWFLDLGSWILVKIPLNKPSKIHLGRHQELPEHWMFHNLCANL